MRSYGVVELRRTDADDAVALREQELGEVGAVLARDAGDQRGRHRRAIGVLRLRRAMRSLRSVAEKRGARKLPSYS